MLGFLYVVKGEMDTSQTALQLLQHGSPWQYALMALWIYASMVPITKGARHEAFGESWRWQQEQRQGQQQQQQEEEEEEGCMHRQQQHGQDQETGKNCSRSTGMPTRSSRKVAAVVLVNAEPAASPAPPPC
jgi:hypothetical protein